MKKYLPLAALFLLGACNQAPTNQTAENNSTADTTCTAATVANASATTAIEIGTEDLAIVEEKEEKFVVVENAKDIDVPFYFTFKKAGCQTKASCKDTTEFASLVKGPLAYKGIWSTCDVNEDGKTDYLICVKGTSKEGFETNDADEKVDRNRRGFILAIDKGDHFETDARNLNCFLSENEDGGVYFAPELEVSAKGRILTVNYSHGRYGSWGFTFTYKDGNYELTACNRMENNGPVTESETHLDLENNTMKVSRLKGDVSNYGENDPKPSDYTNATYKVKPLRKLPITEFATVF